MLGRELIEQPSHICDTGQRWGSLTSLVLVICATSFMFHVRHHALACHATHFVWLNNGLNFITSGQSLYVVQTHKN